MRNTANITGYYLDPEGFVPAGKNESYFALGPGLNADGSNRFMDPKDPDKFDYGSGHRTCQTMTEYEDCTGEGGRHPYVDCDSEHRNCQTMTEYEDCTGEGGRHPYVSNDDDL